MHEGLDYAELLLSLLYHADIVVTDIYGEIIQWPMSMGPNHAVGGR